MGADEYVDAWTVYDERVLAGMTARRALAREAGEWRTVGWIPAWIHALAEVPSGMGTSGG